MLKRGAIILSLFVLLPLAKAGAASPVEKFVFITEPRTVNIGEISEEITIQAQDAGGNPVAPNETVDLEFLSGSSTGEFLNVSGQPASKVMNRTWKNRTFYYRDSFAGTYALTVKAAGRESGKSWTASQQIVVSGPAGTPSPSPDFSSSSSSFSSGGTFFQTLFSIKADAGPDKIAFAGSSVEFIGGALGLKGEPLDNARFFWNFGDGETYEGRNVRHTFQIPGRYTVGLRVSSGEYSASDYATATVLPNKIAVSDVLIGEAGFIKFLNSESSGIDIGGWIMEDSSGRSFVLPPKTLVGAGSEIALLNSVTGLLKYDSFPITVYFPNLAVAFKYVPSSNSAAPLKAAENPSVSAKDSGGVPAGAGNGAANGSGGVSSPSQKERAGTAEVSGASPIGPALFFGLAVFLGALAAAGFVILKKV